MSYRSVYNVVFFLLLLLFFCFCFLFLLLFFVLFCFVLFCFCIFTEAHFINRSVTLVVIYLREGYKFYNMHDIDYTLERLVTELSLSLSVFM